MSSVNVQMDSLQVAATGLITDFGDLVVRGYLKDHPDIVAHRLGLVAELVAKVQAAVDAERAGGQWPALQVDPADGHDEDTAFYCEHECNCEYCFHSGGTEALIDDTPVAVAP
ncbi:hypothetical protein ACFVUY_42530 [Kitasatospora sp. NPDC058063]|uniref:hypothetical protein n=1 Tax=unclassified Kitasatospora TaxID=2633591 RepID=UPI0036DE56B7